MTEFTFLHLSPFEFEELARELVERNRNIKLDRFYQASSHVTDFQEFDKESRKVKTLVEVKGLEVLKNSELAKLVGRIKDAIIQYRPTEFILVSFNNDNIKNFTFLERELRRHFQSLPITHYPEGWIEKELRHFPDLVSKYNLKRTIDLSQSKEEIIGDQDDQLKSVSEDLKDRIRKELRDLENVKKVAQESNESLRKEQLKEIVFQVLIDNKDAANIIREQEFYFQKAVNVLRKIQSYDSQGGGYNLSIFPILEDADKKSVYEVLYHYWKNKPKNVSTGNFSEFLESQNQSNLIGLYELIIRFITYVDYRAWRKQELNEYPDKRVVAASNVRQTAWIDNILKYCINNFEIYGKRIAPSIKNAISFLEDPKNQSNILSENHRVSICKYLLGKAYDIKTFNADLIGYFKPWLPSAILQENISCLITRILYDERVKSFWQRSSDDLPPIEPPEDDFGENEDGEERFSHSYFSNTEVIEPALNVDELAFEMATLLSKLDNKDKGRIVGIFGDWGRGKTYLFKRIWKRLEDEGSSFVRIKFHPWKYQDTPASWAYLYEAFSKKYFEDSSHDFLKSKFNRIKKSVRLNAEKDGDFPIILFAVGIVIFGFSTTFIIAAIYAMICCEQQFSWNLVVPIGGFTVSLKPIVDYLRKLYSVGKVEAANVIGKLFRKNSFDHVLGVQAEIERDLKSLIRAWFSQKGMTEDNKILLFVDDIDRCEEEQIIKIIDSLRVMLEDREISERVIVVLAVDSRVLKRAIGWKYHNILSSDSKLKSEVSRILVEEQLVREYMDKLFLVGLRLGPLTNEDRREVLDKLIQIKSNENTGDGADQETVINTTYEEETDDKTDESKEAESYSNIEGEKDELVDTLQRNEEAIWSGPNDSEKENLLELGALLKDATPRQLRIFYYRYLLGRNLLLNAIKDSGLSEQECLQTFVQWLFIATNEKMDVALLIKVWLDPNTESLSESEKQKYIPYLNRLTTPHDMLKQVFYVLSTVVAY